jgi:chemotaxis family two-component system response regulator Rcp1
MSNASSCAGLRSSKSLNQIEVLVVQSNPADTLLTVEAFKAAGLTRGLRCVTDGEDALTYVRQEGSYANVPTPDLIFLDLSQPRVSGLEVLKMIKSTPGLMHIPIVVAAGTDDPKFVRSVYALNGNCFIRKPGELTEFLRFIETCYEFWGSVVTLCPKPHKTPAKKPLAPRLVAGLHTAAGS